MNPRKTKEDDDLPRYFPWMIECARRLVPEADAEDVALEALNDAYAERQPRPPAIEVDRVKLWLFTLVAFRAKDYHKKQKKWAPEFLWENPEDILAVPDPLHGAAIIDDREWILQALPHLPEDRRAIVLACSVEGVAPIDLARARGVSKNTLHSWLRRAHAELGIKMRELLEEPRRRLGLFFPFDLFGFGPSENGAPGGGPWAREALRVCVRVFGPPLQIVASAAVVVFIVGFTPSNPCSVRNDRVNIDAHAESRGHVVVARSAMARSVFSGRAGGHVVAPALSTTPIKINPVANRPPKVSQQESPTAPTEGGDGDFALLLRAKAAYNRANAQQAITLLDEHACKYPNSENAIERKMLRAAAARALAKKR